MPDKTKMLMNDIHLNKYHKLGISVFRVSWIRVFLRAHFRVEIDYLRNTFALTVVFCRINEVHLKFCVKSLDCQSEQFNKKMKLDVFTGEKQVGHNAGL